MATIHQFGFTLFLILCFHASVQVSFANTTHCWQQKCRECPETSIENFGEQVKCDPRSLVSLVWLDSPDKDEQTSTNKANNIMVDYSCIKMVVSTNSLVDTIRGCTLKSAARNLCEALVKAELARGKKDAKCSYCEGDYCNGAIGNQVSLVALTVSIVLAKILNH